MRNVFLGLNGEKRGQFSRALEIARECGDNEEAKWLIDTFDGSETDYIAVTHKLSSDASPRGRFYWAIARRWSYSLGSSLARVNLRQSANDGYIPAQYHFHDFYLHNRTMLDNAVAALYPDALYEVGQFELAATLGYVRAIEHCMRWSENPFNVRLFWLEKHYLHTKNMDLLFTLYDFAKHKKLPFSAKMYIHGEMLSRLHIGEKNRNILYAIDMYISWSEIVRKEIIQFILCMKRIKMHKDIRAYMAKQFWTMRIDMLIYYFSRGRESNPCWKKKIRN